MLFSAIKSSHLTDHSNFSSCSLSCQQSHTSIFDSSCHIAKSSGTPFFHDEPIKVNDLKAVGLRKQTYFHNILVIFEVGSGLGHPLEGEHINKLKLPQIHDQLKMIQSLDYFRTLFVGEVVGQGGY